MFALDPNRDPIGFVRSQHIAINRAFGSVVSLAEQYKRTENQKCLDDIQIHLRSLIGSLTSVLKAGESVMKSEDATFLFKMVVSSSFSLLDLEEPSVVGPVTQALQVVNLCQPDLLKPEFAEFVDIFLGWATEGTLTREALAQVLETIGMTFGPMWQENTEFGVELMGNFAQDMAILVQEGDDLDRLLTLAGCFVQIARNLTQEVLASTGERPALLQRFLATLAATFQKWVFKKPPSEQKTMVASVVSSHLTIIIHSFGAQLSSKEYSIFASLILHFTSAEMCQSAQDMKHILAENLKLLAQIQNLDPMDALALIHDTVGSNSALPAILPNLRFFQDRDVMQQTLETYTVLMVRGGTTVVNHLRREMDKAQKSSDQTSASKEDRSFSWQKLLSFNITVMRMIPNVLKTLSHYSWTEQSQALVSVIQCLKSLSSYLLSDDVGEQVPTDLHQIAILTICELLELLPKQGCISSDTLHQNGQEMVSALVNYLNGCMKVRDGLTHYAALKALKGLHLLANHSIPLQSTDFQLHLLQTLINVGDASAMSKIKVGTLICFQTLVDKVALSQEGFDVVSTACMRWVNDSNDFVSSLAVRLLSQVSTASVLSGELTARRESGDHSQKPSKSLGNSLRCPHGWLKKYVHDRSSSELLLPIQDARRLISQLLHLRPKYSTGNPFSWLLDSFSQALGGEVGDDLRRAEVWACYESAAHMVTRSLKTHLGNPAQTFTAFEHFLAQGIDSCPPLQKRLLLNFLNALEHHIVSATESWESSLAKDNSQKSESVPSDTQTQEQKGMSIGESQGLSGPGDKHGGLRTSYDEIVKGRLRPSKRVALFFATNRKVCSDWFARIRPLLLAFSTATKAYEDMIYHGLARVEVLAQELLKISSEKELRETLIDMEMALFSLVSALLELGESDTLQGLQCWIDSLLLEIQSKFKKKQFEIPWLDAAVNMGNGNYEKALKKLENLFMGGAETETIPQKNTPKMFSSSTSSLRFCFLLLIDCIYALSDWNTAENMAGTVKALSDGSRSESNVSNEEMLAQAQIDFNNLQKWSDFELDELEPKGLKSIQEICGAAPVLSILTSTKNFKTPNLQQLQEDVANSFVNVKETLQALSINGSSNALSTGFSLNQLICLGSLQSVCTSGPTMAKSHAVGKPDSIGDGVKSCLEIPVLNQLCHVNKRLDLFSNAKSFALSLQAASACHQYHNFEAAKRALAFCNDKMEGLPEHMLQRVHFESAQLGFSQGDRVGALLKLCSTVQASGAIVPAIEELEAFFTHKEIKTKANNSSLVIGPGDVGCQKLAINSLLTLYRWIRQSKNPESQCPEISVPPSLLGKIVSSVKDLAPDNAEARWVYAEWCLSSGNKLMEALCDQALVRAATPEEIQTLPAILTGMQKAFEDSGLTQAMVKAPENMIEYIAIAALKSFSSERGLDEQSFVSCISKSVPELSELASFGSVYQEMFQTFIKDVNSCLNSFAASRNERLKTLFSSAADGYSSYLALCNSMPKFSREKPVDQAVAALRLLDLFIKQSEKANDVGTLIAEHLHRAPIESWFSFLSQLLSHMGHPDKAVSHEITTLLERVASAFPQKLLYPAVVGYQEIAEASKNEEENVQGEEPGVKIEVRATGKDASKECQSQLSSSLTGFQRLMQVLIEADNAAVLKVEAFVKEIVQISNLWDERWYYILQRVSSSVQERLNELARQANRMKENHALTNEEKHKLAFDKFVAMLKPIVAILEKLEHQTLKPYQRPSSQLETSFQQIYGPKIEHFMEELRNPSTPTTPSKTWQLFVELRKFLSDKIGRRSSLNISELSSTLSSLLEDPNGMPLMMPGVEETDLKICGVENHMVVFHTKTRPKRIVFRGSDGSLWPYLLKGREDLHLDQRVMQVLRLANRLLDATLSAQTRDSAGVHSLCARTYAVVPMAPKAGLIEWVQGAVPLYQLYKRHQASVKNTESLLEMGKQQMKSKTAKGPGDVPKQPNKKQSKGQKESVQLVQFADIFYGELVPALKEQGVDLATPRHKWPRTILVEVHRRLCAKSPRNFVKQELWQSCITSVEWWGKVKAFSRTLAVMSMLGYVIGLGDRHLDNILLDLEKGDIVHIDYNICFDKGKRLKVPEVVPFRLTQCLQETLGPTGFEGKFRLACERTMSVLRANKSTVLSLLESFVYDPLVDWTSPAAEDTAARKRMELSVNLTLFTTRVAELRPLLGQAKAVLDEALTPSFLDLLQQAAEACLGYAGWKARRAEAEQTKVSAEAKLVELGTSIQAQQWQLAQHKAKLTKTEQHFQGLRTRSLSLLHQISQRTKDHNDTLLLLGGDWFQNQRAQLQKFDTDRAGKKFPPLLFEEGRELLKVSLNDFLLGSLKKGTTKKKKTHVKKLLETAEVTDQECKACLTDSLSALLALHSDLQGYVSALKALGTNPQTYARRTVLCKWQKVLENLCDEAEQAWGTEGGITFGDQSSTPVALPDISSDAMAVTKQKVQQQAQQMSEAAAVSHTAAHTLATLIGSTDVIGTIAALQAWTRESVSKLCAETHDSSSASTEIVLKLVYGLIRSLEHMSNEEASSCFDPQLLQAVLGPEVGSSICSLEKMYQKDIGSFDGKTTPGLEKLAIKSAQMEGWLEISSLLLNKVLTIHPISELKYLTDVLKIGKEIMMRLRNTEAVIQDLNGYVTAAKNAPSPSPEFAQWAQNLNQLCDAAAYWRTRLGAFLQEKTQLENSISNLEKELESLEQASDSMGWEQAYDLENKRQSLTNSVNLQQSRLIQLLGSTETLSGELQFIREGWLAFFNDTAQFGALHQLLCSINNTLNPLDVAIEMLHTTELEWESCQSLPAFYSKLDYLSDSFHRGTVFCDKVKIIGMALHLIMRPSAQSSAGDVDPLNGIQVETLALARELMETIEGVLTFCLKPRMASAACGVIDKYLQNCIKKDVKVGKPGDVLEDYLSEMILASKQAIEELLQAVPLTLEQDCFFSHSALVPMLQRVLVWGPKAAPRLQAIAQKKAETLASFLWHNEGFLDTNAKLFFTCERQNILEHLQASYQVVADLASKLQGHKEQIGKVREDLRSVLSEIQCEQKDIVNWDQSVSQKCQEVNSFCQLITLAMGNYRKVLDLETFREDMREIKSEVKHCDSSMLEMTKAFIQDIETLKGERWATAAVEDTVKTMQDSQAKAHEDVKQSQIILQEVSPIASEKVDVKSLMSCLLELTNNFQAVLPQAIDVANHSPPTLKDQNIFLCCQEVKNVIDGLCQSLSKLESDQGDGYQQDESGPTKILLNSCKVVSSELESLVGTTVHLTSILRKMQDHIKTLGQAQNSTSASYEHSLLLLSDVIHEQTLSLPEYMGELASLTSNWESTLRSLEDLVSAASHLASFDNDNTKSESRQPTATDIEDETSDRSAAPKQPSDSERSAFKRTSLSTEEVLDLPIKSHNIDLQTSPSESGLGSTSEPVLFGTVDSLKQHKSRGPSPKEPVDSGASAPNTRYVKTTSSSIAGQNVHALRVVQRVSTKLCGKDKIEESNPLTTRKGFRHPGEHLHPRDVSEQVQLLIQQASSLDTLSIMYEGWTPWI